MNVLLNVSIKCSVHSVNCFFLIIIIIIFFFRYLDVKTFYHLVLYYIHINFNFIK